MSKVLARLWAHAMLDPEGFVEARDVPSDDVLARLLVEAPLRNENKAISTLNARPPPSQTVWPINQVRA